jgi:hypothetical protein
MAQIISYNAKVQRPGVCNAMESMLVHYDVAARFLPSMLKKFNESGVEIRGCLLTRKIAKNLDVPISVVRQELERRKQILLKMVEKNLRDFRSVHKALSSSLNVDDLDQKLGKVT